MIWMPTRFIIMILILPTIWVLAAPFTLGHNFKKEPLKKGCRKFFVRYIYKFFCALLVGFAGMRTHKVYRKSDYSFYLGPNYKNGYK